MTDLDRRQIRLAVEAMNVRKGTIYRPGSEKQTAIRRWGSLITMFYRLTDETFGLPMDLATYLDMSETAPDLIEILEVVQSAAREVQARKLDEASRGTHGAGTGRKGTHPPTQRRALR